ncbi:hypothetical protein TanjilG_23522 [Lupinus angustifolius]|uniref:Copper transport protein n=1 Tax=Lupinus angustifolius TaxID=3871 RepID=A0A4P1R9F1_LUPAN|nr:PREDICTED: copper transporter 6-like [Lupinus angustifolius]OIW05736.1 hypothetical protein TanjilG_23522 [Lupinus angustifolius]
MDGHMHDMGGMHGMEPSANGNMAMPHMKKHFMHMTFFWGKDSEILFDQWPGDKTGMYVLALVFVFVMSFLVELLSSTRFIKSGSNHFVAGLVQTVIHLLRVGLSFLVMLALMSFNGGVFLVAVVGHALGFFIFGSNAFKKKEYNNDVDLPPMHC